MHTEHGGAGQQLVVFEIVERCLQRVYGFTERRGERKRNVEHGVGVLLRQVGDPNDLPVRHKPHPALPVPNPGGAQGDLLDRASRVAEIDHVADAVLILGDHEKPCDDIPYKGLGTERQRTTDNSCGCNERAQVDANFAERGDGHDQPNGGH